jgi:uncharacterized protein YcbX
MNKFDTQIHCDENFDLTPAQLEELMRESAEIQDAQATSWEGIFEDGHTDEAYDAWRESQIHDGIWN